MNILSLCDGMSGAQIALKELSIPVENYYASEIDKNSIKVTMENFPDTVQIGDVTKITDEFLDSLPKIDLVCFGSPCRSLTKTTAGREKYNNGLKGTSGLFYDCNRILQYIKEHNNPDVKFLVENVDSNNKNDLQIISETLGVEPVLINSNLFSAQDRVRYYWTNIPIEKLPESNDLVLKDILDTDVPEKYFYKESFDYHGDDKKVCGTLHIKGHDIIKRINNVNYKCPALTACRGGESPEKDN